MSSARRRATVVSHAPGLAGRPAPPQAISAWANASWTHSSARSRSRVTRTVAASTKAHSRRCASATAAATSAEGGAVVIGSGEDHHGTDLDAAERRGHVLGDRDRLVQVLGLDEVVAAERFLR